MSLLSLVDPASTTLWRISFAIVAAGGVLALVLVRGPAPTGLGAAAYGAAVVLYVLIALVAVVPSSVADLGVLALPVADTSALRLLQEQGPVALVGAAGGRDLGG